MSILAIQIIMQYLRSTPIRDPNHYAVFEVYADPAAVDAHVSSARFRRFDSANQPMIANKRVHPIGEEIDVSEIVK